MPDPEDVLIGDGGVPEDAEYYPDGFHSGDHYMGERPQEHVPIENQCVECGKEGFDRCGCCGMALCGMHHELGAGFCSKFTETRWPVCVWGESVYVFPGFVDDHEVLRSCGQPADVYHLPEDPGDEETTAPACRPVEDGKERVAMRELPDDAELCTHCESVAREAAEEGGGDDE